ncbi:MAG: MOSC domain-containing protein [Treponema sp.]|jgi:TatD DNase family protein|nr:MOSC domain-containing protein [Treponema sp.]
MGIITAICTSIEKGTAKTDVGKAELVVEHGIKGDAHAGGLSRQVSLLSLQKINAFRTDEMKIEYGAFGENIIVDGIDLAGLSIGTKLRCGQALLEITQKGKECHNRCAIYERMGDCIMPTEGVFARVLHGGIIKNGDEIYAFQ